MAIFYWKEISHKSNRCYTVIKNLGWISSFFQFCFLKSYYSSSYSKDSVFIVCTWKPKTKMVIHEIMSVIPSRILRRRKLKKAFVTRKIPKRIANPPMRNCNHRVEIQASLALNPSKKVRIPLIIIAIPKITIRRETKKCPISGKKSKRTQKMICIREPKKRSPL